MSGRRGTVAQFAWFMFAILAITVLGTLDDVIRHAAVLVPAAIAAVVIAYVLGRRHGRGRAAKTATSSLEAAQRDRLVAELETLAGRTLDEITESYRVIARRHGGDAR